MKGIQKLARGRGSLGQTQAMMEKIGITRPLLVGSARLTARLMQEAEILQGCPVFSGYHPNPDLADAEAGAECFRSEGCDGLISIGGGSAMDTAKAIKALMFAGSLEDAAAGRFPETMPTPHLAIPGTAGSGAESTQTAVTYVAGSKISLNHPSLRPDAVILDASLLESLPLYHKKSCAMDALAQGIESFWSRGSNNDSKVHAYLAIIGVLDNLNNYLAGDPHAAEEMLDASFQSGKAIQITRTTAAHAMSYMLTKQFGLAHGHACMLTLPTLWEMMQDKEHMQSMLEELSGIMRLSDMRMVPKLLKGILFALEMDIPPVPSEEKLEELADSVNTERLENHPVTMTKQDVKTVYRRSMMPPTANEKQACLDIWRYYGRG